MGPEGRKTRAEASAVNKAAAILTTGRARGQDSSARPANLEKKSGDGMPDTQQRPSFWTTVPGIMTGTASLITALVGLAALLMRDGETPPQPLSPASTADTALPADDPAQSAADCRRIAGDWDWSTGGVVRIGGDGGLQWRANPADALPTVVGRWVCTDSVRSEYLFTWSHGFSDVFALSEDGQRVNGTNQQTQTRLFGNRRQ